MTKKNIIPHSIRQIYEFIAEIKPEETKEPNPIPIKALSNNPFFVKDDIKKNMTNLWEVLENEEIFIWSIQSSKWNKKIWRNHFINKLKSNLV